MSLLDAISKLTTPASALPDIEDDDHDGTSARKLATSRPKSKFANADTFEEGKYAGKKVSRQDLFGDMSEISGLSNQKESDSEEDADDEEEEEEDEEGSEDGGEVQEAGIRSEDDDDGDDEDEEEEEEAEAGDSEDNENDENDEETNTGITKISFSNEESSSTNKAECIQRQRKVWDDIMYTNIRMHALLNASNQLPRGDSRKNLLQTADQKTKENLAKSLKNMSQLRQLLKETNALFSEKVEDEDDEEIPSDEEVGDLNSDEDDLDDEENVDDEDEGDDDEEEKSRKSVEQGISAKGLSEFLKQHDEEFDKFRSTTITKWYNRTKLLSAKSANNADFSVFEKGSILSQINKVLNDEAKFVKKVRTNRSGKKRIGNAEDDEIDDEIFDDSDFYQILLKQMIESRSNNTNTAEDGADMTRSYMELQKMFNNKKKRDVTSLSSKDRRLKYEPIAKLINFFPAKPSVVTWSHESRNELFKSLFS